MNIQKRVQTGDTVKDMQGLVHHVTKTAYIDSVYDHLPPTLFISLSSGAGNNEEEMLQEGYNFEVISSAPYKFFYSKAHQRGTRLSVAYKTQGERVEFKYAVCNPKDRFTRQAGRYYSMNAQETFSLPSDYFVGHVIKNAHTFDCSRIANSVLMRGIEVYIRVKESQK